MVILYVGREDLIWLLLGYFLEKSLKSVATGRDVSKDRNVLQRFKEAARDAKHRLTDEPKVDVELPFVQGLEHMKIPLDRKKLEELVAPIMYRLEEPCLQALDDAGLAPEDITDVLLVGGMTRMPAVKRAAKDLFNQIPLETINPDHAVALGAAVQAGLLQGFVKGVSLLDVTSLSLGIEIQGATMHTVIPRNSTIPTKKTEIFTTSAPNQPQVSIHVLQGESDFSPDNKSLGRFELMGVKPAPRGVPDIAVSFEIDAEGIVHVSAKDLQTDKEQRIEIIATSGLSDYEIDKLLRDKAMEEEQRVARERARESKTNLKAAIFMTQVKLNTEGKRFKGRGRVLLEDSLTSARDVLQNGTSATEIEEALKGLTEKTAALEEFIESLW
ncbi:UNVERIFIED_CONTAM: hypothetical protein GTU68_054014 [Idotea baltica]|nr:hypothetical protein [Idotea baltica]